MINGPIYTSYHIVIVWSWFVSFIHVLIARQSFAFSFHFFFFFFFLFFSKLILALFRSFFFIKISFCYIFSIRFSHSSMQMCWRFSFREWTSRDHSYNFFYYIFVFVCVCVYYVTPFDRPFVCVFVVVWRTRLLFLAHFLCQIILARWTNIQSQTNKQKKKNLW